jgi:hypothetical protein
MKQSITKGIFTLHGKLLYLLWVTYKIAKVGQLRLTALVTSIGMTEEESLCLKHATGWCHVGATQR